MTQPNLIETIEKALEAATPGPWIADGSSILQNKYDKDDFRKVIAKVQKNSQSNGDTHLIANAPEWLRDLLEENKQLQQKLKEYEGCRGIEDYYRVLYQLRETREENNRLQIAVGQFKAELSARRTTHET